MAAQDLQNPTQEIGAPAANFAAVTPSNTDELQFVSRALYVGTGGDLVAVRKDGTSVLFKNVPSGSIIPIRVARVHQTGTTATDIVTLW